MSNCLQVLTLLDLEVNHCKAREKEFMEISSVELIFC